MSGKPKTIPSPARDRSKVSDTREIPVPYDQNRASKSATQISEESMSMSSSSGSDAPTDENFVNDDIIEENSHVIPPVKKAAGSHAGKRKSTAQ